MLEKLLRTLQTEQLSSLFLTHHHPDHHEHAPELARRLNLPICMSEDTFTRIKQRHGGDYFSALQIELKRAGDCLTRWKGEAVRVHAVPGHDAGQLALAPESLRWFLVGDLIQSIGTVVVSPPEGDMAVYFETLEKIIRLDPQVIIPSHGLPMRGTSRLQTTLEHRRKREKSIQALLIEGKTPTEMLNIIYPQINPDLRPFALQNIAAHLGKLQREENS